MIDLENIISKSYVNWFSIINNLNKEKILIQGICEEIKAIPMAEMEEVANIIKAEEEDV